ncbi:glycosyltransferase [Glycomyces xiaoerkulensis]|uniref:glycosyltransferase n=1 Tax=Glycomyces xiaoerkulensis TaxID=2038139 RepID=UPI000C25C05E|nr:glycosyltransferase [Glycomyces xiaoerkulensis]
MPTSAASPSQQPRIRRNDHGVLSPPDLGAWMPDTLVSVVIPAYGSQDKLDVALAALAAQSYPSELLEVIVVDDQSEPELQLPQLAPDKTKIVRVSGPHWGSANAVHIGIQAASGDVVLRLDADILTSHRHVEAHARWHHQCDYLAVVGRIAFADIGPERLPPQQVHSAVAADLADTLFEGLDINPSWEYNMVEKYDQLRTLDDRAWHVANGATISFSRRLYEACGGMDTAMILGGDTEFGYRMAQAGAVLVPDGGAVAWHLGMSQMKSRREEGRRYREPFFANSIPMMRHLRNSSHVVWEVPYVEVVIDVRDASFEDVSSSCVSVLNSTVTDVGLRLLGPWSELTDERRSPLDEPLVDLRLIAETFRADPRVEFAEDLDQPSRNVPFRLTMPVGLLVAPNAVSEVVRVANTRRVGKVNCAVTGFEALAAVTLERTAALSRALHLRAEGETLEDVIDEIWGVWWEDGDDWFGTEPPGSGEAPSAQAIPYGIVEELKDKLAKQRKRAEWWKQHAGKKAESLDKWRSRAKQLQSESSRAARPWWRSVAGRARAKLRRMLRS